MSGKVMSPLKAAWSKTIGARDPGRFACPSYLKALFDAGARASYLGVAMMDSQTRFESVNAAVARETRITVDQHLGKTSREIVGDLALQIEPIYEKVFRTAKPASVWLAGHVRDTVEFGHWFDHCFPISDSSGRVQQLGLFVVNVTAERESGAIFSALPGNSGFPAAISSGLLPRLDDAIHGYYLGLESSFEELSHPSGDVGRKADHFHLQVQRLDNEIRLIRELVYAVLAQFHIPSC
jgi:PAS fold